MLRDSVNGTADPALTVNVVLPCNVPQVNGTARSKHYGPNGTSVLSTPRLFKPLLPNRYSKRRDSCQRYGSSRYILAVTA